MWHRYYQLAYDRMLTTFLGRLLNGLVLIENEFEFGLARQVVQLHWDVCVDPMFQCHLC